MAASPEISRKGYKVGDGDITSNEGIELFAQVDQQMELTRAIAQTLGDTCRKVSGDRSLL